MSFLSCAVVYVLNLYPVILASKAMISPSYRMTHKNGFVRRLLSTHPSGIPPSYGFVVSTTTISISSD